MILVILGFVWTAVISSNALNVRRVLVPIVFRKWNATIAAPTESGVVTVHLVGKAVKIAIQFTASIVAASMFMPLSSAMTARSIAVVDAECIDVTRGETAENATYWLSLYSWEIKRNCVRRCRVKSTNWRIKSVH